MPSSSISGYSGGATDGLLRFFSLLVFLFLLLLAPDVNVAALHQ